MANALVGVKPKYDGENKRVVGAAQVTEIEGKVKITYLPKKDWKNNNQEVPVTFTDGKVSKIFEMSQVPVPLESGFDEVLVVHSDEEGVKVFSPFDGTYKCEFVEFSRPNGEGTLPIWKESEPKTWSGGKGGKARSYTTLDFRAYLKISTNRFFKDVVVVHFLQYLFTDNGAGSAAFKFELLSPTRAKQSKHGQKLIDLCTAYGMVDTPIEWPEDGNILPELEKRAQQKHKQAMVSFKDGWITDITPVSKLSDDGESAQVAPETKKEVHEPGISDPSGIASDDEM